MRLGAGTYGAFFHNGFQHRLDVDAVFRGNQRCILCFQSDHVLDLVNDPLRPDTEQLLLPSVDVDAYLAKLVGPSFKLTHKSFEMDDMTVEFDETTQCYKIPVTGSVGTFRATVTRLFKKDGLLHVTVGYIPTQSSDDSILNTSSDTPTKYMDYLFSRQSGSWYLTGLTDSETKPESADSAASAAEPAPLAESEVNDAILATAGDSAAASVAASAVADEAAPVEEAAESTPAESTEASSESPAA